VDIEEREKEKNEWEPTSGREKKETKRAIVLLRLWP